MDYNPKAHEDMMKSNISRAMGPMDASSVMVMGNHHEENKIDQSQNTTQIPGSDKKMFDMAKSENVLMTGAKPN